MFWADLLPNLTEVEASRTFVGSRKGDSAPKNTTVSELEAVLGAPEVEIEIGDTIQGVAGAVFEEGENRGEVGVHALITSVPQLSNSFFSLSNCS